MKSLATLLVLALASPALAGECDQWTADMQEDEGGPVMTAMICAPGGEVENLLLVTCGGNTLSLRYLPVVPDAFPPAEVPEYREKFDLTIAGKAYPVEAVYEAMDGAMAFEIARTDPAAAALRSGKDVTFSDPAGIVPKATFTLKNAGKALEKLEKTCTQ